MVTIATSRWLIPALLLAMAAAMASGERAAGARGPAARLFALKDVRLLDGPFKHAQEMDRRYLLMLEPDRLLHGFRREAGMEPKGEIYGGWEAKSIAGHSLGHYLSACALMYGATGDEAMKQRVEYIVAELAAVQAAHGDGYFAAIPGGKKVLEEQVARGDIRSKGFDLNGIWVPWYTIHKQLAGLLDAHEQCGSGPALTVACGLADWIDQHFGKLSEAQWQKMLACEHGGMNESLAELHARTGDERYLRLARQFGHRAVLDPLAEGRDILPGLHANTQVPKVIGAARLHELTGRPEDRQAAEFFWRRVVHHHSYVNGGNSDREHFGAADRLANRLSPETAETCNVYNMLKLTEHLFTWGPDAQLADFYERALYNQILASQHPGTGMMRYFMPLRPGRERGYCTPFDSFWCCTGSGMENHGRYGAFIYAHDGDSLYVNLFVASELRWSERDVTARLETGMPASDRVMITITAGGEAPDVCIRVPHWGAGDPGGEINGAAASVSARGGYLVVPGSVIGKAATIELTLPMGLRLEAMPDDANRVAICYGPVVLAGDLGPMGGEPPEAPVLVTDERDPSKWLEAGSGEALAWRTHGLGNGVAVTLRPMHTVHERWYTVYWDLRSREQWAAIARDHEQQMQRERELAARTVDVLIPGQMQPERDHNFDGERTNQGRFNGRTWRDARDGGQFGFDMKVDPAAPMVLRVTYWGSDAGGRQFDILVDGKRIATQTLESERPGAFFDVTYPIEPALTQGRQSVRLTFKAHEGKVAGGIFGCATLRASPDTPR